MPFDTYEEAVADYLAHDKETEDAFQKLVDALVAKLTVPEAIELANERYRGRFLSKVESAAILKVLAKEKKTEDAPAGIPYAVTRAWLWELNQAAGNVMAKNKYCSRRAIRKLLGNGK